MKTKYREQAFTLLEILIVILIMGVLTTISIPLVSTSFANFQFINSSKNIISLMRYARERSILERVNYRLAFNIDAGTYCLLFQKSPFEEPDRYKIEESSLGKKYQLPEGVTIERIEFLEEVNSSEFITFYPDGSADSVNIYLCNDKGESLIISTQIAGQIKIVKEKDYVF